MLHNSNQLEILPCYVGRKKTQSQEFLGSPFIVDADWLDSWGVINVRGGEIRWEQLSFVLGGRGEVHGDVEGVAIKQGSWRGLKTDDV